jgi:ABC-2 type transport system ATP-binding protein
VLDLAREARAEGRTVIFSSHVLSEVEETCDRVTILRAGRVVHGQSIEDLRRGHRIHARLADAFPGVPAALAGRLTATAGADGRIVLETEEPLGPLFGWLATLPLAEVRVEPVGLQAVYDRFHSPAARSA